MWGTKKTEVDHRKEIEKDESTTDQDITVPEKGDVNKYQLDFDNGTQECQETLTGWQKEGLLSSNEMRKILLRWAFSISLITEKHHSWSLGDGIHGEIMHSVINHIQMN